MSMRVTMRNPSRSEDGLSSLLTGQTYTVGDDYGLILVRERGNIDTDGVLTSQAAANRDELLPAEVRLTRSLVQGAGILPASNYTYESSGAFRLVAYTRGGVAHSISYPTSTSALITSAQGYQRSITLDASGRTVGVV